MFRYALVSTANSIKLNMFSLWEGSGRLSLGNIFDCVIRITTRVGGTGMGYLLEKAMMVGNPA